MNSHSANEMTPHTPSNLHTQSERKQSAPKLMFFGDPHGDLEPVIAAVEHFRPEAVVLLGDIQARQPLHVELGPILGLTDVWFIHGNHDTDTNGLPQDVLDLATQVFGAKAQAWLGKPHELLDGQTPAAFAVGGGSDKLRSMLIAIQHGGVV